MKMPLVLGLFAACALPQAGAWAADAALAAVSETQPVAPIGDTDGNGVVAAAPTEAQADAAFDAARKSFMAVAEGAVPSTRLGDIDQKVGGTDTMIAGGAVGDRIALEDIKLVLDVEDASLREVVTRIVSQAARYTGPWTVKWRLRPENLDLMDERVNLTVEAPFGEFCQLLTERVKNMTGTQLYVTAFKGSRSILVTDTYY